jgi:SAM-dependent methyltransferase
MIRLSSQIDRAHPCDLCGQWSFELLAQRDRRGDLLDTVICRTCGLVTHGQLPQESDLAEYYQQHYRFDYHGEYTPSPHRVVREWNRGRELVRLLTRYLRPQDEIIEIGCGIGCTVANFVRAGYCASGVEPGEGFRRYAVDHLKIFVRDGVLADLSRQPRGDVILLVHVLEHLLSPSESLSHIHALLRDQGHCYVEVPNAGAPHAAPGKMFHYAHIYNFTRDTLAMLATKAGFSVVTWLSSPRDKNLRVLLQRREATDWHLLPGSYDRAMRAVTGHSPLSYVLRWNYLQQRVRTLISHQSDRILSRYRVARILRGAGHDQCQPIRIPEVPVRFPAVAENCRHSCAGSAHAVHSS